MKHTETRQHSKLSSHENMPFDRIICPGPEGKHSGNQIIRHYIAYGREPDHLFLFLALNSPETPQYKKPWLDDSHEFLFTQIIDFYKPPDPNKENAFYAALFLLSTSSALMKRLLYCFSISGIFFERADLRGISYRDYALYKSAKALYLASAEVGVDEAADPILVDNEAFRLIQQAMEIYRIGLSAIGF